MERSSSVIGRRVVELTVVLVNDALGSAHINREVVLRRLIISVLVDVGVHVDALLIVV